MQTRVCSRSGSGYSLCIVPYSKRAVGPGCRPTCGWLRPRGEHHSTASLLAKVLHRARDQPRLKIPRGAQVESALPRPRRPYRSRRALTLPASSRYEFRGPALLSTALRPAASNRSRGNRLLLFRPSIASTLRSERVRVVELSARRSERSEYHRALKPPRRGMSCEVCIGSPKK